MFNWGIIGHKNILDYLENCVTKQRIANAYLFYGPSNIGKRKAARQFIKSIYCSNGEKTPCGECLSCRQVENEIYPDVFSVKKKENKKNISIEQIRDMRSSLFKGSFLNSYKIGFIEEAELLNDNGWNSLLKILEEPPQKTIIILIASQISNIPDTILSRCQKLKFSFVPENIIYDYLREKGLSREYSREIARISNGKTGIAKERAGNPAWINEHNDKIKEYLALFDKNKSIKYKNDLIQKLIKNKSGDQIFDDLIIITRDLALLKIAPELIINLSFKSRLNEINSNFELDKLNHLIEQFLEFKKYLSNNINPKVLLEKFILTT